MQLRHAALLALSLTACGDDGVTTDGGPGDVLVPVDIDNGSCGDQIRFTGEYMDVDTAASFCGINAAVFQVDGGGAMDSTAPNGRFDLCIPDQPVTRLTVTQPGAASQCTTPSSTYAIPVIAVARKEVVLAGGFWSGRAWTTAREATLFQGFYSPGRETGTAQVIVHVDGPARAVSLAAGHDLFVLSNEGGTWDRGDSGTDVFFGNVDVGTGTTTVSVEGGAIGEGEIPLAADTLTLVTVKTN